jgi:hypothetical protein
MKEISLKEINENNFIDDFNLELADGRRLKNAKSI